MKRWLWLLLGIAGAAWAQSDGRLYVAGAALGFEQAIERAIAQNPSPGRFFVLVVGDATRALSVTAPEEMVAQRRRAISHGALFMVCERDIDQQRFALTDLVPGVIAVRGWPKPGGAAFVEGTHRYGDEDAASLPASAEALRRLRASCS